MTPPVNNEGREQPELWISRFSRYFGIGLARQVYWEPRDKTFRWKSSREIATTDLELVHNQRWSREEQRARFGGPV